MEGIQDDIINSSLIKIETLQKEYEVLLNKYQEAVNNYILSLQNSKLKKDTVFVSLKGRTWWGTSSIQEKQVSSKEECAEICANSSECSGATFNSSNRYCWTRKGDSSITVGTDNNYAIILEEKYALVNMKNLNDKLLELNKKILDEIKKINPKVEDQINENNMKQEELIDSYNKLLEQKVIMDEQMREYSSIEENENNQYLYVNQQNVQLRFWFLLVCIILLFTINSMIGFSNVVYNYIIRFIIIILFIFLSFSLRTPSGFFMWFILLIVFSIIMLRKTD